MNAFNRTAAMLIIGIGMAACAQDTDENAAAAGPHRLIRLLVGGQPVVGLPDLPLVWALVRSRVLVHSCHGALLVLSFGPHRHDGPGGHLTGWVHAACPERRQSSGRAG